MARRGRKPSAVLERATHEVVRKYLEKVKREIVMAFPKQCSRCGGMMVIGYNDATCLQCGEYMCSDADVTTADWPPHGEVR